MKFDLSKIALPSVKTLLIALAVIVLIIVLIVYFGGMEKFTGLDSDILRSIGLIGGEQIEPEFQNQDYVLPLSDQSECMKPSDFQQQQQFLTRKVDQLTSNDLIPSSDDFVLDNNYLISGFQHGADSRVAKNANQQLRADPLVPVIPNLTPFNQPVITDQDTLRKPLE